MKKRMIVSIIIVGVLLAGCSSGKYADKIDKAVSAQKEYQADLAEQRHGDVDKKFDQKEANIYVYDKGKYISIAYKPLKKDAEVHYYTYRVNNDKAQYLADFNSKGYAETHEPDYKEENMNLN